MANKHKSYKKFVASAVSASVVVSAAAPVGATTNNSLKDVSANSFGFKEINYLLTNDIIQGYPDNTFRPSEKLNRGQAARLLYRALNLSPKANNQHEFKDIPKTGELAAAISAVSLAGIFKGDNGSFDATRPLSREEMASVLVRAFDWKENSSDVNLKDLNTVSPTHLNDVKVLYQNGITLGYKDETFRPAGTVTRAEFSVFLYRSIQPENQKVESVSDQSIKVNGVTYGLAESVKGLLNSGNAAILKNANIKFEVENKQISNITFLEIVESGKPGTTEFAGNLVLDARNNAVSGNVKISGNYITLKNLVINGNLEITKELQNDFYSSNLVVKGNTIVNGGDSNTVVFHNANLQAVNVNKQDVRVEPKGNTTLSELTITNNATITADDSVTIPKLTLKDGAKSVEINANVNQLSVESKNDVSLTGTGSIETLTVSTDKGVNVNTLGTIKNLNIGSTSSVNLSKDSKVENLILPAGKKPQDVIKNYDAVKDSIKNVNGKENPDSGNPTPNPNPDPGPDPDRTPPVVTSSVDTGTYNAAKSVTLTVNEPGTIYYTLDGTEPTTSSSRYTNNPILISQTTTLKYFAVDNSGNRSAVVTKTITIDQAAPELSVKVANPRVDKNEVIDPKTWVNVESGATVDVSGSIIRPDGTLNTTIIGTFVLTYVARDAVGNASAPVTITLTVKPAAVLASYSSSSINVSGAEPGAILKLYKKGTPDTPVETFGPVNGSYSFTNIEAGTTYFVKQMMNNIESDASADVIVPGPIADNQPPTVTRVGSPGTYKTPQTITLTANEPATIYFTLDGTPPTRSSSTYTGPILIDTTKTLKYFAVDLAGNASQVETSEYVIDQVAPTLTSKGNQSIVKGDIVDPLSWVTAENGATVRITGSIANQTGTNIDTSAIGNHVLTYTATDAAGNSSEIAVNVTITPAAVTGTVGTVDRLTINVANAEPNAILELYKKGTLDTRVDIAGQGTNFFTNGIEPGETYYVKQIVNGISSAASDDIPVGTNLEITSTTNSFVENTTYNTKFIIAPTTSESSFGPETVGNPARITKDVSVINSTVLQNLIINGNLTIDPGEDGEVSLKNVTVTETGKIIVKSGKLGTINFQGVTADEVLVTDSNGVRLATDGNSNIRNIVISPEQIGASDVELQGNFNATNIRVIKQTKITAKPDFAANSILVALDVPTEQVEFIGKATPLLGDIEFPTVYLTKPGNIKSDGSIGNINVTFQQTASARVFRTASTTPPSVGFEGNFSNSNIDVNSNVTFNVTNDGDTPTSIGSISAGAPVALTGTITQDTIQSFEKKNDAAQFSADTTIQDELNKKKAASIAAAHLAIDSLPEVGTVGIQHRTTIDTVQVAINTAQSLGAQDTDFNSVKLAKWDAIEKAMRNILNAVKDVEIALAALPSNPITIKAIGYKTLQDNVNTVNAKITTASTVHVSITPEVISGLRNFGRLQLAINRLEAMDDEKNAAIVAAVDALADLPSLESITITTVSHVTLNLLKLAKEKVAIAMSLRADANDFANTNYTNLAALEIKIYQFLAEQALITKEVNSIIQQLPSDVTIQNLAAVNKVRDIVNRAKEIGVLSTDPDKLVTAEQTIVRLVTTEVNSLFAGNNPLGDAIAPSVSLGKIATVKNYVDGLHSSVSAKVDLQVNISKAYFLLGKARVLTLFNGDQLAAGVTKVSIDETQTFFNSLPISVNEKSLLELEISRALNLFINGRVQSLFNANKTALAAGVTKESIAAARQILISLQNIPNHAVLESDIQLAYFYLGKVRVDALFNSDKSALGLHVTKDTIDAAKQYVDGLTDLVDKSALLANLSDAYNFIAVARIALLFNSDETALLEGVTDTAINETEAFVNSLHPVLKPSQIALLSAKFTKARQLLTSMGVPTISNVKLGDFNVFGFGTLLFVNIPEQASIRYLNFNLSHNAKYEIIEVLDSQNRNLLDVFPNVNRTGDLTVGEQHLDIVKLLLNLELSVPASYIRAISPELTIKIKVGNQQDLAKNRTYSLNLTIGTTSQPTIPSTIEEHVARLVGFYSRLSEPQKIAFRDAANEISKLNVDDWNEVLGTFGTTIDAKLGQTNLTARGIIADLADFTLTTTPGTVAVKINDFRSKYAEAFDEVFGADVTVEALLRYVALFETEIRKPQNMATLFTLLQETDLNDEQLKAFLKGIRDDVESQHDDFAEFDAKLIDGMGMGLDGVFLIGHNLLNKIKPNVENYALLRESLPLLFITFGNSSVPVTIAKASDMNLIITHSDEEAVYTTDTITLN
jgi:hypothetical protein